MTYHEEHPHEYELLAVEDRSALLVLLGPRESSTKLLKDWRGEESSFERYLRLVLIKWLKDVKGISDSCQLDVLSTCSLLHTCSSS